jgi:hypothetical protein
MTADPGTVLFWRKCGTTGSAANHYAVVWRMPAPRDEEDSS